MTLRNIALLALAGALLSGCYAHVYHPGPVAYGYYEQPGYYGYGHGGHHRHGGGGHGWGHGRGHHRGYGW